MHRKLGTGTCSLASERGGTRYPCHVRKSGYSCGVLDTSQARRTRIGTAGGEKQVTTRAHLLLAAAAIYYIAYVWRLSFVIGGTRYFLLADDVMITMCYGRTLADVGQLAWYPGGPGGGYSSIVWVWLSALAWKLWPVASKTALLIQAFNGAAYVLTAFYVIRAAGQLGGNRAATIAGVLTIACWPVVNMYAQGWEFSMVALGLVAGYYYWLKRKWWPAAAAVALIGLTRFPLPTNTMAVKLTGYPWLLMVTRGARMEFRDLLSRGLPLLVLVLIAAVVRKWGRERWLPLGVFAVAILLSVAIGGDAWHTSMGGSRIAIATLPLLAILGSLAVVDITRKFTGNFTSKSLTAIVVLAMCLTWTNPARTLLMVTSWENDVWHQELVRTAGWVNDHTERDAKIAIVAAGIIPWLAQRQWVDLMGLNDAEIARLPAHRAPKGRNPLTFFHPGHMKFSPALTVTRHDPDVILQFWGLNYSPQEWAEIADRYETRAFTIDGKTFPMLTRIGSTKIH